ncbi:MAG TPA: aromatic acid/H+ symport family MFS transporter [Reyranella sp.]|jgi:AAHS family 4-hydroxybenzoate transporter-like MFS transporter|nr:aromatic acid/H+ symport family MFS transporter [Reyranella sp.]
MAITKGVEASVPSSALSLQIRVAVLCGLIQMLDGYDLSAIGLAVPSLIKAWSLPPPAFTQAFALSSVGIMVGALSSGPLADRFGRKPILLVSVALFGVFSLLSAYASSLGMLVAMRFFTGIGIGGAMPTTVALTSDYSSERWRAPTVMFMFTGNTVGGFFAGQIAAQVLPHWGWQGIFLVGGIVPLVLLVVLLFALPESPQFQNGARPPSARENPVSGLFKDGLAFSTVLLWAIFLINLLNMYLISYWLPTVLNLGGLSPADAAFATSMYAAGGVLSTLLLGPVIARFGPERTLAVSLAFGALCIGLLAGAHLPHGGVLLVLFGAGGGFVGSQLGLNGFCAAVYPAATRSTGIGWALGVGRLGGIAGPIVGGALLGLGLPPNEVMMFAVGPGLVTAGLVTWLGLHRKARRA